ncbi:MAG: DUF1444 family protein [Phycisphaerales bacterium]|nr:DUF1444 family protein [Phycisphaerales bacterium]
MDETNDNEPMPSDSQAFTQSVVRLLKGWYTSRPIETISPLKLTVDGKAIALENLFRMVQQDPQRGANFVRGYFDRIFEGDSVGATLIPFAVARHRIMPRIQPESIFESVHRESIAHLPYVNGTVIVFVMDMPEMTVSVSTEQMVRWGIGPEELEEIARKNLCGYAPDLQVQVIASHDGGRAALLSLKDGYDAARLLLSKLHERLAKELRGDFYVATPARDVFIALSYGPDPFIERVRARIARDYSRLPYPITSDFFIVTRDGVAGTAQAA